MAPSSRKDNLCIHKRLQTGNLYLAHIPQRRKELKMMGKADGDGSGGREALLCLKQMAKSSHLSPAKPPRPQGLGEHPEVLTWQLHLFIHPELPLLRVRRSPPLQLVFFNGSTNSGTIKPGEV